MVAGVMEAYLRYGCIAFVFIQSVSSFHINGVMK